MMRRTVRKSYRNSIRTHTIFNEKGNKGPIFILPYLIENQLIPAKVAGEIFKPIAADFIATIKNKPLLLRQNSDLKKVFH